VETRALRYSIQCETFWFVEGEEPTCVDPAHDHLPHEVHHHRNQVVLPDGTSITAVSFDPADPYGRDRAPDVGFYLDPRWQPPWPHEHIDWPDYGVPADVAAARDALESLLARARRGEHVEIGCLGAHGRTGTALAWLAVLTGVAPDAAVEWVRAHHCDKAVETEGQQAFVLGLTRA
jgi:hypothetical protein